MCCCAVVGHIPLFMRSVVWESQEVSVTRLCCSMGEFMFTNDNREKVLGGFTQTTQQGYKRYKRKTRWNYTRIPQSVDDRLGHTVRKKGGDHGWLASRRHHRKDPWRSIDITGHHLLREFSNYFYRRSWSKHTWPMMRTCEGDVFVLSPESVILVSVETLATMSMLVTTWCGVKAACALWANKEAEKKDAMVDSKISINWRIVENRKQSEARVCWRLCNVQEPKFYISLYSTRLRLQASSFNVNVQPEINISHKKSRTIEHLSMLTTALGICTQRRHRLADRVGNMTTAKHPIHPRLAKNTRYWWFYVASARQFRSVWRRYPQWGRKVGTKITISHGLPLVGWFGSLI